MWAGPLCAGGRRPAREIAAREPSARSRRSRSPARPCRRPPAPRPGSAGHAGLAVPSMREPAARSHRARSPAKPSGPSGTLHTGGAIHCCAHPIQDPPPTGAAAKPHSQAPRASRFPPCVNLRLGVVDLEARPSPPAPPAPSTPVGLFIAVGIPSRPRRQAPQSGLSCPAARASPSTPVVPGVLVGDRRRFEARLCPAPPTGTAVGHQPGAVCPALVSNLARWGVQH